MFPILLATCFFFAFNDLGKMESFETVSLAYVSETSGEDTLREALLDAKLSDDTAMFQVVFVTEEEAKKQLEKNKIEAYIIGREEPILSVKENGINETIVKSFLDSYRQMTVTIQTILQRNPNAWNEGLIDDVMQYDNMLEEIKNSKNPDPILIYFYSLLAYTCIFAASWGLDEVINIQADLSIRGARVSVTPIHKMKLFICNLMAAFTAHLGSLLLLFIYMYYIIRVNFGENLFYLFIICMVGSLTGLFMGATIGVWVKKKAEVKEAIVTIAVLGGGFLSGMMVADMKLIIAEKAPIIGYINPVSLVTDAMYSLYYYDTYERLYLNMTILCALTIIFGVASYIGIRRKNYASI
jgi:ABC-2 type transport system permease protein